MFLKKYYPQVFIEECQYTVNRKSVRRLINYNLEVSFDEKLWKKNLTKYHVRSFLAWTDKMIRAQNVKKSKKICNQNLFYYDILSIWYYPYIYEKF